MILEKSSNNLDYFKDKNLKANSKVKITPVFNILQPKLTQSTIYHNPH
jgi:hypothetical protein